MWVTGCQSCQGHKAGKSQKRKKNAVGNWLPMLTRRKLGMKQKKNKSTLGNWLNSNAAREGTRQEAKTGGALERGHDEKKSALSN